jgi:hypothetical protein
MCTYPQQSPLRLYRQACALLKELYGHGEITLVMHFYAPIRVAVIAKRCNCNMSLTLRK